MVMEYSFCCGKSLTDKKEGKKRKVLSSPGMTDVVEILTALASKFPAVDSAKLNTGYACQSCGGKFGQIISKFESAVSILPQIETSASSRQARVGHRNEVLPPIALTSKSPNLMVTIFPL